MAAANAENPKKKRHHKLTIPRRTPSVVIPPRPIIFITPDKTTCEHCPCFPKEDPYVKNKKLKQCQQTPLTLYELAAAVVDGLKYPDALGWSVEDVANWMSDFIGFPQYAECIRDNHIDGMRLLMFEDPSKLPSINICEFRHILIINYQIHDLYGTEFIKFSRSIGLPPRKPLTHCTWFKSRTGPSWGIRKNWTRCDILRWMKILMPAPVYLDHWDLVWYVKPEFPKVKFARIPKAELDPVNYIPIYKPIKDVCHEYLTPRKFRIDTCIPEEQQFIWMQRRPKDLEKERRERQKQREKQKMKKKKQVEMVMNVAKQKIYDLTKLRGRELILARRLTAKPKFLTL